MELLYQNKEITIIIIIHLEHTKINDSNKKKQLNSSPKPFSPSVHCVYRIFGLPTFSHQLRIVSFFLLITYSSAWATYKDEMGEEQIEMSSICYTILSHMKIVSWNLSPEKIKQYHCIDYQLKRNKWWASQFISIFLSMLFRRFISWL